MKQSFRFLFSIAAVSLTFARPAQAQAGPTFSDANWVSLPTPPGSNGRPVAMVADTNGNVYLAGGEISSIFKWNGRAWSTVGSGTNGATLNGEASCLACDNSGNLYAGGGYTSAGGVNIAKWNGSAWSALGSGVSGVPFRTSIKALALDSSGNLYASGAFTNAGGVSATNVAKWNGSAWSALGSGVNVALGTSLSALALDHSGNLYVGGVFTNAGSVRATNIAKWDGSAWSSLGLGVNSQVTSLAFDSSGTLYASGARESASGIISVVKWSGSAWSPVGSGMDTQPIISLAVDSFGNLYAGGNFGSADGVPVHYIAKWNGSAWSALGSGVNNTVYCLTFDSSGNLYVGGDFSIAGTNSSAGIAKALLSKSSYNLSLTNLGDGTHVISGLGTPGYSYALDLATNLTPPVNWMPQATNAVSGVNLVFTNVSGLPQGFYRTRYVPQ